MKAASSDPAGFLARLRLRAELDPACVVTDGSGAIVP